MEPVFEREARVPPPGHLPRARVERVSDLAAIPAAGLATELLARLRTGEGVDGSSAPLDLLAGLSMELECRSDLFDNRFSRARASAMFHKLDRHFASGALKLGGATTVELGCGSVNPWGNLLVHALAGTQRAIGIDLDPPQDVAAALRGAARIAGYLAIEPGWIVGRFPLTREEVARRLEGFDLERLWNGDAGGLDAKRVTMLHEPAERTSLEAGVADCVHSISFLEHVPDPDAVLAEIARITRPGGVSVHGIDGTDHHRYAEPHLHPLAFLMHETGERLVHESNRVRPLQFAAGFERHGFEVLACEVHERVAVGDDVRVRLVEPFRSLPREELEAVSVTIHARKR